MRRLFTIALLAAGCGGGGGGAAPAVDIGILSHGDRAAVAGTISLSGWVAGGQAEVAVDSGPYVPTEGGDSWSIRLDTDAWGPGWHTVQARVRRASRSAWTHVNLYCGSPDGPIPPPPSVPPRPTSHDTLRDGLVAHWSFNNASAGDSSGNGHHGWVYGSPAWVTGASGKAVLMDGVDDRVAVPHDQAAPPAEIGQIAYGTISLLFRYDSIQNGSETATSMPLFYFGADPASTATIGFDCIEIYISHGSLHAPENRQIFFTVLQDESVVLCFDSIVPLEQGVWYHYAVSIGPNGHRAYLDGERLTLHYNSGTGASDYGFFATVADQDMLALGYGLFGIDRIWWRLNGLLDDVRIYDRVLTDSEVAKLASYP